MQHTSRPQARSSDTPKVIVFDLDGTLVDTAPDLTAALNHCLGILGRAPLSAEAVRHLVGHGARALLTFALGDEAFNAELVEAMVPVFLEHYSSNICVGSAPYRGLEQVLDRFAAEGAALAICSNKSEALTRRLVAELGWSKRFASIVGGDTCQRHKPDPQPLREAIARAGGGHAVFVGDSIVDALTARAASVRFIAVSFGFSDRPVEELGADETIDDYSDLPSALARLRFSRRQVSVQLG